METQIVLTQIPKIKHELVKVGSQVEKRISDLNIDNQIVTTDTIQSMKSLRAALNKELGEYEEQRKKIKNAILDPYSEFENTYKEQIVEKFTGAISTLKSKIEIYEIKLRDERGVELQSYFNELCIAEQVDFVKFEQVIPNITMTPSIKKYKDEINSFIEKVIDDIKLCESEEFSAEILAEYKTTLNASKAITTVRERKVKEKEQHDRMVAKMIQNRISELKKRGFVFVEITRCYELDSETYITEDDVNKIKTPIFNTKIAEFDEYINNKKAQELEKKKSKNDKASESTKVEVPKVDEKKPKVAPLSAPIKEDAEPIMQAKFLVKATRSELLSLGAYLKQNNLNYTNIK